MDRTVPAGAATLLAFIYQTETGKPPPECYEVIYAHKQYKLTKPLTSMTLDEVQAAQRKWSKNHGSSAAGAPQFMRATLRDLMRELGLRGSQKLDPDLQDRLAYHLLKRRGYEAWAAGTLDNIAFAKNLAKEWASLPVLTATQGAHRYLKAGQSYYAGDGVNKALVSTHSMLAALNRARSAMAAPIPAPRPAAKPKSPLAAIAAALAVIGAAIVAFLASIGVNLPW